MWCGHHPKTSRIVVPWLLYCERNARPENSTRLAVAETWWASDINAVALHTVYSIYTKCGSKTYNSRCAYSSLGQYASAYSGITSTIVGKHTLWVCYLAVLQNILAYLDMARRGLDNANVILYRVFRPSVGCVVCKSEAPRMRRTSRPTWANYSRVPDET